ncbi:hypothetical protein VP01_2419g1 [Puccinia sorghi]|uniref:Uncharacterized protein n=1 Tax=Puccinia sorghi TaxID=27349 RepID=A0A0L6V784_9BASI|nr:hypothetical protein VP01_2419g1 [Puccinia sorghi]
MLKSYPLHKEDPTMVHRMDMETVYDTNVQVGSVCAIKTLKRLMEAICLRRTKDVLLYCAPKTEWAVLVHLNSN